MKPRAYTEAEVRDILLDHIRGICKYWANDDRVKTKEDLANGVAFSILSILDGDSPEIPAIDLVLRPHKEDKDSAIEDGENYYKPGMTISCVLHEHFYKEPK